MGSESGRGIRICGLRFGGSDLMYPALRIIKENQSVEEIFTGWGSTVIIVWVMTIKGPIKNLRVGTVGTGKRCPVEILLCAGAGGFTVIGLIVQ